MRSCDAVVVGAGVVGAACAYFLSQAGLRVVVVDRGAVAGGTTGAGEGNLLVSDKEPGPELDLALLSLRLWRELADELDADFEYEAKGGLVVARTDDGLAALRALSEAQQVVGVTANPVAADELSEFEPHLAPGLPGAVYYPQDAQVQPALAAAHLLRAARVRYGAELLTGVEVTGVLRAGERLTGVRTGDGDIAAAVVVNAAGSWGSQLADVAGVRLPVLPRRGFVLVTEPLPPLVRHKVYTGDYVADVASDAEDLQTSAVVEGTPSGTILIGASRERVGFDRTLSIPVLARLAAQAIALFPVLADVSAIRAYCGFRPYCPDHLPVVGADARLPGFVHACGHEGAGIGLAAATGHLIAQQITGEKPDLDLTAFSPDRFTDLEVA